MVCPAQPTALAETEVAARRRAANMVGVEGRERGMRVGRTRGRARVRVGRKGGCLWQSQSKRASNLPSKSKETGERRRVSREKERDAVVSKTTIEMGLSGNTRIQIRPPRLT
jgi:hypothetical protein